MLVEWAKKAMKERPFDGLSSQSAGSCSTGIERWPPLPISVFAHPTFFCNRIDLHRQADSFSRMVQCSIDT